MAAGTVPQTASDWAFGSWAFAVEVAMVVGAGVVGYRLASAMGRGVGWLAAAGAVLLVGVFWAMWMSPNADHRLPVLPRVIVASLLVLAVAYGLWRTGSTTYAAWFGPLGVLGMVIAQPALAS